MAHELSRYPQGRVGPVMGNQDMSWPPLESPPLTPTFKPRWSSREIKKTEYATSSYPFILIHTVLEWHILAYAFQIRITKQIMHICKGTHDKLTWISIGTFIQFIYRTAYLQGK